MHRDVLPGTGLLREMIDLVQHLLIMVEEIALGQVVGEVLGTMLDGAPKIALPGVRILDQQQELSGHVLVIG